MRWFFTNACGTSIIPTIVGLLSGGLMSGGVSAQESTFPSRLIQIVAPFPAGGSADFFARVMADKLSAITGRRVIVEPKPGASGIIGTRAVISSAPDGYTLLSTSVASILVPPNLIEPRPFDPLKDVAPITPMAKVPALLVAHPKLGVQTLPELVKYVKANPGKVNIANSGTGTVAHLAAELLKREAKIDIVHVAYRGAPPAVNDLLGGHAQLMFSDAAFFLEHIRTGRLVALAVGTTERIPSLPDVPTTAEVGYPSLLADNTYALFAPAGTPPDIIQKLNELVLTALSDPAVKQAYANQSATTAGMKVDAFKGLLQEQAARWIPLAKDAAAEAK